MAVTTLAEKIPGWLTEEAPASPCAVASCCTVTRNLADFPFPGACSPEEKQQVVDRIHGVLDGLSLLSSGDYFSFDDLTPSDVRFLAERGLVTQELMGAEGPRAVYVSDDQGLSVQVNSVDHLQVRTLASGCKPQEAWARLNLMDDTLGGMLDFAFKSRLGYLTTNLGHVGTGLLTSVVMPPFHATTSLTSAAHCDSLVTSNE